MRNVVCISLFVLVFGPALAQTSDVPPDVPTFNITLTDGTVIIGGLFHDGGWEEDPSGPGTGVSRLDIVYDTPWAPDRLESVRRGRILRIDYEAPALRKARLEKGWTNAGFEMIDTPSGRMPVHKSEREYARRAREMAEAVSAEVVPPLDSPEGLAPAEAVSFTPRPPGLRQWAGHAAIVVAALALLAVVFKALVLGKSA